METGSSASAGSRSIRPPGLRRRSSSPTAVSAISPATAAMAHSTVVEPLSSVFAATSGTLTVPPPASAIR